MPSKFEHYIVPESQQASDWTISDTYNKREAIYPQLDTVNLNKPLSPANMIWYKDKTLRCKDYCKINALMRFPTEEDGKYLGILGFKFVDTSNYYALVIKKVFRLPEADNFKEDMTRV